MTLPDLRALLASGGDDRLALDVGSGLNLYGYDAAPRPRDIAMGSSTASAISAHAFDAVQSYHERLTADIRARGAAAVYAAEIDIIRDRIRSALGWHGPAPAVDILTAPSGTDIHLLAASLLAPEDRPLVTITLAGSETGSAIGTACSGRHFASHSPGGTEVARGDPLDRAYANITLAVRDAAGSLRDESEIEAQLDTEIAAAIAAGRDCLLVVADVSKTGLIAPGLETVFRLRTRHGARLHVLIDACQLRISPAVLRAYLDLGLSVAITGSKFLGGPIFSGALLIPKPVAVPLRARRLPDAMADYLSSADFPVGWAARSDLPQRANIGVLLRWHAALLEWERLLAVPASTVARVTRTFAHAVDYRLRRDPAFEVIATRPLDRRFLQLAPQALQAHDTLPTVFPFLLSRRNAAGRRIGLLNADETRAVYERLARGAGATQVVRLGQPVSLGVRHGVKVSALRLCLSARQIVAAASGVASLEALLAEAMTALNITALNAIDVTAASTARAAA